MVQAGAFTDDALLIHGRLENCRGSRSPFPTGLVLNSASEGVTLDAAWRVRRVQGKRFRILTTHPAVLGLKKNIK